MNKRTRRNKPAPTPETPATPEKAGNDDGSTGVVPPPTMPVPKPLDAELQAIVDSKASPQDKAKAVRMAFSARGWNKAKPGEHGSVRDFLIKHGVPIV